MEKKKTIEERMAALEAIVNGDSVKRDMIRKAKQYPKDYMNYLRYAEVTDSLKVGSDKEGGYLVPDEFEKKLVTKLESKGVMRRISNVIKTEHLLRIPGVAKNPTADWVEEGGKFPDTELEFYQVVIDAHKNGYITLVTEELLEDAGFDIEKYIVDTAGDKIGELEEEAFIFGDGIHKPTGVLVDAPVGHETSKLCLDDALELFYSVGQRYRNKGVWVMSEDALRILQKERSAMGRNIWEGDMTKELPLKLNGREVYVSDAMPDVEPGKCPVMFGDFSYYWIGDRSNRSIKRMGEVYSDKGMVGYRVTHRVDGKLVLPEAIKTLKIAS